MTILSSGERLAQTWLHRFYARRPQPTPSPERLKGARLVAHRGVHDNRRLFENTLPAFERALEIGVWGIEFDVRWTRDRHPVVFHDLDLRRMYGVDRRVGGLTFSQLQRDFPNIPPLEEVVRRFGGRLHLMMELKGERPEYPLRQNGTLRDILSPLTAGADFHFLSFSTAFFRRLPAFPPRAFLPIARFNVGGMERMAALEGYGGLTGHFFLIGKKVIGRLDARGQAVGTGMADSINCFFRELNRGVRWIFSNQAEMLNQVCRDMSKSGRREGPSASFPLAGP